MRSQKEGERVDSFITDLYALAEFCNFGNLRDELISYTLVWVSSINNCQRSGNLRSSYVGEGDRPGQAKKT